MVVIYFQGWRVDLPVIPKAPGQQGTYPIKLFIRRTCLSSCRRRWSATCISSRCYNRYPGVFLIGLIASGARRRATASDGAGRRHRSLISPPRSRRWRSSTTRSRGLLHHLHPRVVRRLLDDVDRGVRFLCSHVAKQPRDQPDGHEGHRDLALVHTLRPIHPAGGARSAACASARSLLLLICWARSAPHPDLARGDDYLPVLRDVLEGAGRVGGSDVGDYRR